jgi:DNA mismatch endonuclease, patch repair protein
MRGNRRIDTAPEVQIRRRLHAEGLRYRKDALIRAGDVRVRPDIVFSRRRVAVFVDGCFWHGCPEHCRMPGTNVEYWEAKIGRNRARDQRNDAALGAEGWRVVRLWEHVPVDDVVRTVKAALQD